MTTQAVAHDEGGDEVPIAFMPDGAEVGTSFALVEIVGGEEG